MPFDGSGNYTPAAAPNFPAVGGTAISSAYYNAVINDIAAALSNCLTRDGQGRPTSHIDFNAKNLSNVGVFSAASGTFSGALSVNSLSLATGLPVASGGTGAATFTTNALLRGNGTSAFTSSGILDFSNAEAIRIDASENVGIGLTSPAVKLDVAGAVRSTSAGQGIRISHDGTNGTLASSTSLLMYADGANSIIFHTNAVAHMWLTSGGNLGIGTNTPSTKLHVVGAGTISGALSVGGALTLGTPLAVAHGGTGVAVAGVTAFTNLGATTAGANLVTVANPGAVSFPRFNADNTVVTRTPAEVRADIAAAASGANTDITALLQSLLITETGIAAANSIGFRGMPTSSQTQGSLISLALSDFGKRVPNTTGGWTIPANGTVAFPVGTVILLHNDSASSQTVAITTDTLRLEGTTSTGTRTVSARGFCWLVKTAATEWYASGSVS